MLQCKKFCHDETMGDVESHFTCLFAIRADVEAETICGIALFALSDIWKDKVREFLSRNGEF